MVGFWSSLWVAFIEGGHTAPLWPIHAVGPGTESSRRSRLGTAEPDTHARAHTNMRREKRQAGVPQGRAESDTMFSWYDTMKVNWNTLCRTARQRDIVSPMIFFKHEEVRLCARARVSVCVCVIVGNARVVIDTVAM